MSYPTPMDVAEAEDREANTGAPMTSIYELIRHLNSGRQADADGVMVTVSRHAVVEAIRLLGLLGETNESLAACQSEAGPCIRDAARYRWIRANNKVGGKCTIELECDPPELCTCEVGHKPNELDDAIDLRMVKP